MNIKKSNINKIIEFFHAIRIVHDSRKLIDKGKYYQVTPIYGQLRALLTDKSKERNKEKKPLFDISELLKEDIAIYYMPDTIKEDMPELKDNMVLSINSMHVTPEKQLPGQKQISLEEYLNTPIITYKNKSYKTCEIINALSDKYGGSHYDTKVPAYLMELASFGINNRPILDNLIIQIADLFIEIGIRLIKKLTDFDYYLTVYLNNISSEENFIFDYTLPNSKCRFSFLCYQKKLHLHLCDLIGRSVNLELKKLISMDRFQLVNITHKVREDLNSEIKVSIDGVPFVEKIIQEPLLMINEIYNYKGYFNRSLEKEKQEFEFGFREAFMFNKILDDKQKASFYTLLDNPNKNEMFYFKKNSYGYSAQGKGDVDFKGKVINKEINKNGA